MQTLKSILMAGLTIAAASYFFDSASAQQAQTPAVNPADLKATAEAIAAVQDQQKTLAGNQGKIDAKLANIAENVRVARLYASRAR